MVRVHRSIFALLLLAGLAGLVTGQAPAQTEHALSVHGAAMSVFEEVDTGLMTEENCGSAGSAEAEFAVDGTSFTVTENAPPGTGCIRIAYAISLPAAAGIATIAFVADRDITRAEDNPVIPPGPPPAELQSQMAQYLEIRFPDGTSRFENYFHPASGDQNATPFERAFLLPNGTTGFEVVWGFQDFGFLGPQAENDPGNQGLIATVGNISLQMKEILLPLPTATLGEEDADEEAGVARAVFTLNVTAPAGSVGPLRTSSLSLQILQGPTLRNVTGPRGAVDLALVQSSRVVDEITHTISAEAVTEQGPGDYTFALESTRTLPPPSAPPDPTRIYWLYYILLAAPLVGAVLATQHSVQYAKEAHGRYVRNARVVLATVVFVIAYYALVALYSFFVVGRHEMSTLPLSPAAVLIDFQLILVAVILVLAAFTGTRLLTRNMRRDLDERQKQTEMLRRSNEELERFAYVASHDLQEPLRKVAGFTALLQRRYKGRLDKDADEMIDYAVDGATRMQALIRDILAYSRINSSQLDLQVVDVGALMDLVASDLDGLVKSNHASLTWRGLPAVRADPSQLRQVLQNLVENGIKYRHPTRKPRIDISAHGDGENWTFRVADNGVGIPPNKAQEVFGIFRRLHGREVPGTGIGLAIVKKALERHGGTIRVAPRRGGGSVFIFTLPYG